MSLLKDRKYNFVDNCMKIKLNLFFFKNPNDCWSVLNMCLIIIVLELTENRENLKIQIVNALLERAQIGHVHLQVIISQQ